MFQDAVHLCLCSRKLLKCSLQFLIGGCQIGRLSGSCICQRLGQFRARLSKRLTGSQKIPRSGFQARQCFRVLCTGSDRLNECVADRAQAVRQSGTGGLKCLQFFRKCIPLRRPLKLALRISQDLTHPPKAAVHV